MKRRLPARILGLVTVGAFAIGGPAAVFAQGLSAQPASTPAASFRETLDHLLGAHAILAQLAMQAGYAGSPEYAALVDALNQNTQELSNAIGSIYGSAAGAAFQKMWAAHIQDFVNYVVATKKGDTAGQQAALSALAQYRDSFARFMAQADPHIDATALADSLQTHVAELIQTFQAYVQKDYSAAATDFVNGYNHMFMSGDYLANAVVEQFPGKFNSTSPMTPSANLAVTLDRLLGAHAVLAQLAMQAGYTGDPAFSAWASQLSQNTQQLSDAVASVYGSAAGSAFQKLWADHVTDFVNYVVATKKGDTAGQQAALTALSQYKIQFADFLAKADPYVNATALGDSLQTHIAELIATFQANVAGNYSAAVPDFVMAYGHMFQDGGYLANVIADQFPAKFGLSTVSSGLSPTTGLRLLPVVVAGIGLMGVGAYGLLRKKPRISGI